MTKYLSVAVQIASYTDLAKAAAILKGHTVHPDVSLVVAAGSRQIFSMALRDGIISTLVDAGPAFWNVAAVLV